MFRLSLVLCMLLSACGQDAMGPTVVEDPSDPCGLDVMDVEAVRAWAEEWVDEGSCVQVACPDGGPRFGVCNGAE